MGPVAITEEFQVFCSIHLAEVEVGTPIDPREHLGIDVDLSCRPSTDHFSQAQGNEHGSPLQGLPWQGLTPGVRHVQNLIH